MTDHPRAGLTDDETLVLTTLYARHQVCRLIGVKPLTALSVADVQRLTPWPGNRPMGRARISAALRSLANHGLATRTHSDVDRYWLHEQSLMARGAYENTSSEGDS